MADTLPKKLPDFQAMPMLDIASLPTPIERVDTLERALGAGRLYVKRDDLTGSPYGGNKVRKLEYLLGHWRKQGAKRLVTVGGTGTNHGLATTIYAAQAGFKMTLILFPQPITDHVRLSLKLYYAYGAEMIYAPSYLHAAFHMIRYYGKSVLPFAKEKIGVIPAGGSNEIGCLGFVSAAFELKEQIEAGEMKKPDAVFCPLGSSGTMAGLALGFRLAGIDTKLIGVRVVPPFAANAKSVAHLANRTLRFIKKRKAKTKLKNITSGELIVLNDYLGERYGDPTEKALAAMRLAAEHGVKLEPTYSAKAFAALADYAKEHPKETLLFWDTFNSKDLAPMAESVRVSDLPKAFHKIFDA